MKVFYFCARTIVRHICGTMGLGMLCPPVVGSNLLKWSVSVLMLHGMLPASFAQTARSDSVADSPGRFRVRQLAVPSVLIAAGLLGASNSWSTSFSRKVNRGFHDWRAENRFKSDDYLQYLPVAANVGLGFVGASNFKL